MVEIRTIEECGGAYLQGFVDLVDHVFIRDRCRSGSMLRRYPSLFRVENWRNLFTAWCDGQLIGTAGVKELDGVIDDCAVRGAMVGLVAVRSTFRRQGFGATLIARVSDVLASRGLDFSVLWTTTPGFYSSIGWSARDNGVFAQLSNSHWSGHSFADSKLSESVQEIERVRRIWQPVHFSRTALDYSAVPPSVDAVTCLRAGSTYGDGAYAIVGIKGSAGSVYEIVGSPQSYQELWDKLIARFSVVYINDCEGSASFKWMCQNTELVWNRQSLAMWMTSDRPCETNTRFMHIPYFDRI